jgi:hypothetical protein
VRKWQVGENAKIVILQQPITFGRQLAGQSQHLSRTSSTSHLQSFSGRMNLVSRFISIICLETPIEGVDEAPIATPSKTFEYVVKDIRTHTVMHKCISITKKLRFLLRVGQFNQNIDS